MKATKTEGRGRRIPGENEGLKRWNVEMTYFLDYNTLILTLLGQTDLQGKRNGKQK